MSTARLLVVTPTLGRSEFLDRTVSSVAALAPDAEHVLCAPAGRLEALRERFPRVRLAADAGPSGGIYGALNAALEDAARRPDWTWFTYINDDDDLMAGFARVRSEHLSRESPEPVAYGDVDAIDGLGRVIAPVTVAPDPGWIPALLQEEISPLMQQGMLFHRCVVERFGGFDTRYRLCADLDFWVRAYAAGFRFRYYPVKVARFRIHGGQLSGDTALTRREQADIVARHLGAGVPRWRRSWTRLRYRAANLPRYVARLRTHGLATSYRLLETGGGKP